MSIRKLALAAAAVVTLAAPAAAFAHDYHDYGDDRGYHDDRGYDRGDYGRSYGYRHDGDYGYRRGYDRDWRARWDGPARYRDHDGWRGYGWRYGDYRHYGYRD